MTSHHSAMPRVPGSSALRLHLAGFSLLLLFLAMALAPPAAAQSTALWVFEDELRRTDLETGSSGPILELSHTIEASGLTLSASGDLLAVIDLPPPVPIPSPNFAAVFSIDLDTGVATPLTTLTIGSERAAGLAEDACGRLYLLTWEPGTSFNRISLLDPLTGALETVTTFEDRAQALAAHGETLFWARLDTGAIARFLPATGQIQDVALDSGLGFGVVGLDFDPDGALWASVLPPPITAPPEPLRRIDLATGTVTLSNAFAGPAIAISPPTGACGGEPLAIPAASPGALALLAGLLALAGTVALARRAAS